MSEAPEAELVVKVELEVAGLASDEVLHDLRTDVSLADHQKRLCAAFGLGGIEADETAIWLPAAARFLSAEDWEGKVAQRHLWVAEGSTVQLRLSPSRIAPDLLWRLRARTIDEASASDVDAAVAEVCDVLFLGQFAAAFVKRGGIEVLLSLGRNAAEPRRQSSALKALRMACAHTDAVKRVLGAGGAACLVRLALSADMHVVRAALDVLCVLSALDDGFRIVHRASESPRCAWTCTCTIPLVDAHAHAYAHPPRE